MKNIERILKKNPEEKQHLKKDVIRLKDQFIKNFSH